MEQLFELLQELLQRAKVKVYLQQSHRFKTEHISK